MRVLHIYQNISDTYQNYISELTACLKKSCNVSSMVYEPNAEADFIIKTNNFKDKAQRALYKMHLTPYRSFDMVVMKQFDILHLQHSFLFNKLLSFIGSSKQSPKTIITLRGGDTYIKPLMQERWRMFYKKQSTQIDAFIVMSNHQQKCLENLGVAKEKINIIPVSVGNATNAKAKYPNKDFIKIVSAFRMTWEKNIEGNMRFAKQLLEKNIPFVYDIYGDGDDLTQAYFFRNKYGLTNHVNIMGECENSLLKQKFEQYDFLLQLSFSESLSIAVIEAQAAGLPAIVSDAGGLPEAVIPGKTAIVGDFHDIDYLCGECINLWRNKELYYMFSANAIQWANNNFTLNHEADKLITLYNNLLQRS